MVTSGRRDAGVNLLHVMNTRAHTNTQRSRGPQALQRPLNQFVQS